VVERPSTPIVRSHTRQVARFCGWIATGHASRCIVRVKIGADEPFDIPAAIPRPDVIGALGQQTGLREAWGFDFYIDLPPLFLDPIVVVLEAADGETHVPLPPYSIVPDTDLSCLDTFIGSPPILGELAKRHLRGEGLEFGALHAPVAIDPGVARVRYADRMSKEESLRIYPEMREPFGDVMVDVEVLVDLDRSDLTELELRGFDFFVANGVLEHLANPLRFLENVHRAMRPGAHFLLSVPDRDFAFDTHRALTHDFHLWQDYMRAVIAVSDEHVADALLGTLIPIPTNPAERDALFEFHRRRGIHVHVWTQASFDEFLSFAMERLSLKFQLLDRASSKRAHGSAIYVLQKPG